MDSSSRNKVNQTEGKIPIDDKDCKTKQARNSELAVALPGEGHNKTAVEAGRKQCVICQNYFNDITELREHTNKYHSHGKEVFKCSKCYQYFNNITELRAYQHKSQ